jgi:hypothetical protein
VFDCHFGRNRKEKKETKDAETEGKCSQMFLMHLEDDVFFGK